LVLDLASVPLAARAGPVGGLPWIWADEVGAGRGAPAGIRYFRKVFVGKPHSAAGPRVVEGVLDIAAAGPFRAWVNGVEAGRGDDPKRVYRFDVARHIVKGPNVLAVEARHAGGAAGLLVRLGYVPSNSARLLIRSDGTWTWSRQGPDGWQRAGFDDAAWTPARELGPYGQAGPRQARGSRTGPGRRS
jgi:hypothetical protein